MGYVTQTERAQGCVFCDKADADRAHDCHDGILARATHSFVVLNAFPYNNGHLMVALRP